MVFRFFLHSLLIVFCLASFNAQAQQMRISGLSDFTIGNWRMGDPNVYRYIDICIYRQNNASGTNRRYFITASGNGPGFNLKSGSYALPYSVQWFAGGTGNPGGGTARPLTSNVQYPNNFNTARLKTDVPTNSSDCNGNSAPTARLALTINATNLDAVPDGTYIGTLNLLVVPQ
jgi:hypothetical protein